MGRIKYKEAIGIEVRRGRPPAGPAPSKADLIKLYVKEGCAGRRGRGPLRPPRGHLMGPFGKIAHNSGNVCNVPVYAINSHIVNVPRGERLTKDKDTRLII